MHPNVAANEETVDATIHSIRHVGNCQFNHGRPARRSILMLLMVDKILELPWAITLYEDNYIT
ncbi:MAG: hypothetical protein JW829_19410 [Pirellulales bacterium]|nr:hypothetical protein [Pirellulales bacterium]